MYDGGCECVMGATSQSDCHLKLHKLTDMTLFKLINQPDAAINYRFNFFMFVPCISNIKIPLYPLAYTDVCETAGLARSINPLKPELNPICYLLALLGAHHLLHVSRIKVKLLTFRLLMSYIYGAPILDVSRSHTTTQHSR